MSGRVIPELVAELSGIYSNSQAVLKVGFHSIEAGCLQMTAGHDS
jgi:hypothetical protein